MLTSAKNLIQPPVCFVCLLSRCFGWLSVSSSRGKLTRFRLISHQIRFYYFILRKPSKCFLFSNNWTRHQQFYYDLKILENFVKFTPSADTLKISSCCLMNIIESSIHILLFEIDKKKFRFSCIFIFYFVYTYSLIIHSINIYRT